MQHGMFEEKKFTLPPKQNSTLVLRTIKKMTVDVGFIITLNDYSRNIQRQHNSIFKDIC